MAHFTFCVKRGVRCVAHYRLWMPVQFLPYCGKSASGRSCSCCVPSRLARRLYASPANTSISSSCRGGMAATTLALRCHGTGETQCQPMLLLWGVRAWRAWGLHKQWATHLCCVNSWARATGLCPKSLSGTLLLLLPVMRSTAASNSWAKSCSGSKGMLQCGGRQWTGGRGRATGRMRRWQAGSEAQLPGISHLLNVSTHSCARYVLAMASAQAAASRVVRTTCRSALAAYSSSYSKLAGKPTAHVSAGSSDTNTSTQQQHPSL